MLYEVFFDSEGQHRAEPKRGQFEAVFDLQTDPNLASSFEFIESCLRPYASQYYVLPGSGDGVTLSLAATPSAEGNGLTLTSIWLDGSNILRHIPEDSTIGFWNKGRALVFSEFREFAAERMIVPKRLLGVELQFPYTAGTKLIIPPDYVIDRPGRP